MNGGKGEVVRVLVVDDEVAVARMVGRWLEREGIVVEMAHSRREGRLGAQLHDIGKIGIRGDLLRKPGSLTCEEADHVRGHPSIGEQILRPMLEDGVILDIVRHHHERWDGRGYPDQLSASEIPLAARIVAVADAYDAMTTARPYRPPRTVEQAIAEIEAEAGRQFDPDIARAAAVAFLGRLAMVS